MKKTLLSIFILISASVTVSAQCTPFDWFVHMFPIDANFGLAANSYTLEKNNLAVKEGMNLTINGELGIRAPFIKTNKFAVAPRLGVGGGYLQATNYEALNIRIPLTLDLSYGAGSYPNFDSKFGIIVGAGYALNVNGYTRTYEEETYTGNDAAFAPFAYMSFRYMKDNSVYGFTPSISMNDKHLSIAFMLSLVFIHDCEKHHPY